MYEVRHPLEKRLRNFELVANKLGLPYEFEIYDNGDSKAIRVRGRLTRERISYPKLAVMYGISQQRTQQIVRSYIHEVYGLISEYEGQR